MSKNINKLHGVLGDYMREIEKIRTKARKEEKVLTKTSIGRIQALRKMIVETSNKLQRGVGWN